MIDPCPQRDLNLRDSEAAADFYGVTSPEALRAMDFPRERREPVPVDYHLSEDPSDEDLGFPGVRRIVGVRPPHWFERIDWDGVRAWCWSWIPGQPWMWAVFFYTALVFFLGFWLGRGLK